MRATILVFTILAVLAAGYFGWQYVRSPSMLTGLEPETASTVRDPDSAQAFRIISIRAGKDGLEYLEPPQVVTGPIPLSSAQLRSLASAVSRRGAEDGIAACGPNPGVEYRFTKGSNYVCLRLCFRCSIALYVDESGRTVGSSDFRHVREQLIRLTMEMFPDDRKIEALRNDPRILEEPPKL